MRVLVSVVQKDHGLRQIMESVHDHVFDGNLRAGVFSGVGTGSATREGGLSNVDIAAIHEFGAPEAGIPERSFIRSTFERNRRKYENMIRKLLPRVIAGKLDTKTMLDVVGQQIVADINIYVRVVGVPPPLEQATIDRKGSSRTLIDTGRMLASVTYVTMLGTPR